MSITETYQTALKLYRANSLNQAEQVCRRLLREAPDDASLWHLLAMIALAVNNNNAALDLVGKAIAYDSNVADFHNTLAETYSRLGKLDEASAQIAIALSLKPKYPEALNTAGLICKKQGDLNVAIKYYRKSLSLRPDDTRVLTNLAAAQQDNALWKDSIKTLQKIIAINPDSFLALYHVGYAYEKLGNYASAINYYKKTIAVKPDIPDANFRLAIVYNHSGDLHSAITHLMNEIKVRPDFTEAQYNLGYFLYKTGQLNEAREHLETTLRLSPRHTQAMNYLSLIYKETGHINEAIALLNRCLEIAPENLDAMLNLGNIYLLQGKLEQSEELYTRCIKHYPNHPSAWNNLANTLKQLGKPDVAMQHYRKAVELDPGFVSAESNLLLLLQYDNTLEHKDIEEQHRSWGNKIESAITPFKDWSNDRDENRILKVGFVSPDFRKHSVAYFLIDLFTALNPRHVSIHCYDNNYNEDDITQRLRSSATTWRKIVGVSDAEAAAQIRDDEIDILVDLSGHSANNRLLIFAYKPAPVQVTWLGYPDTTGLQRIDYRLTDEVSDPPGEPVSTSEKLYHLPDGFLCYGQPEGTPDVTPPPVCDKNYVTFGCFNNSVKIGSNVVAAWAEILHQVPGSRLLLKNCSLRSEAARTKWLTLFEKHGISDAQLELVPRVDSYQQHLALYSKIDVALDVFPYNGTTTTCEALWMGVPVVTIRGNRHLSRVGASLLTQIGLPELIAEDTKGYIDMACSLAADEDRLVTLRSGLRDSMRRSSLGDANKFSQALDEAFRKMWLSWLKT